MFSSWAWKQQQARFCEGTTFELEAKKGLVAVTVDLPRSTLELRSWTREESPSHTHSLRIHAHITFPPSDNIRLAIGCASRARLSANSKRFSRISRRIASHNGPFRCIPRPSLPAYSTVQQYGIPERKASATATATTIACWSSSDPSGPRAGSAYPPAPPPIASSQLSTSLSLSLGHTTRFTLPPGRLTRQHGRPAACR